MLTCLTVTSLCSLFHWSSFHLLMVLSLTRLFHCYLGPELLALQVFVELCVCLSPPHLSQHLLFFLPLKTCCTMREVHVNILGLLCFTFVWDKIKLWCVCDMCVICECDFVVWCLGMMRACVCVLAWVTTCACICVISSDKPVLRIWLKVH
jgi:hypothetical protein